MKLRKILSSVVAGALALSAMTFSASAEAKTVLDFEDGVMDGISMLTDAGADKSVLSVVDYNGSKQLWVDVQNDAAVPKVFFDVGSIVGYDNMDKVAKFECDLTLQSTMVLDDWTDPDNIVYEVPSWQGGAVGSQDGKGGALPWGQDAWTAEEYEGYTVTTKVSRDLAGAQYTNGTEGSHILIMKWASANNPVDMYIDNVVFYDADGNAMELYPAEEAVEEEATEEETTEEAETEEEATEEVEEEAEEEEATEEVEEEAEEEEATEEEEAEEEATEEVEEEAEEEEEATEEVEEEAEAEEEATEEVEEETAPEAGDVSGETESSKGSPNTGIEDVAVIAGLAIVAGGAVLVSKKRK